MSTPVVATHGPAVVAPFALLALAVVLLPGRVTAARRVAAITAVSTSRAQPLRSLSPRVVAAAGGLAVSVIGAALGGPAQGLVTGALAAGLVLLRHRRAARRAARSDPWDEAAAWDRLAACLRAGLPLEHAARAVTPGLVPAAGAALGRMADLLALGADQVDAWEPALGEPTTARLARAARRSARSGAAVADVAESVAADVRAEAADTATARAERAGVLVTGPLGLCFLPAFLALGIVPVVIGLAGPLLEQQ